MPVITRTYTRVHTFTIFANPYLACTKCSSWVTGWHDEDKCGCNDTWWNEPCGHRRAGTYSACPSWGPVDGCQCVRILGHVPHGEPPETTGELT